MRFRSAKGQLPFVEVNGVEIADSAVIVKELGAMFNADMDAHLTSEQRNVAHATITSSRIITIGKLLIFFVQILFSPMK